MPEVRADPRQTRRTSGARPAADGADAGPPEGDLLPRLLVASDDPSLHAWVGAALADAAVDVRVEGCAATGLVALLDRQQRDRRPCRLLVFDLAAQADGAARISEVVAAHPHLTLLAIDAAGRAADAVASIHQGAYDYLVRPLTAVRLAQAVGRGLGLGAPRGAPLTRGSGPDAFHGIVTADPRMLAIFAYLRAIARSGQPLLITGETGTGKDLVAQAAHRLGGRSGTFVACNVCGMEDAMFADTLFGHRRGAFTGADDTRPGLVLRASAGTLFLDEIGDLSVVSQVKLLRLLQDGEYFPLGSDLPKHSTARVVAATSADLRQLQAHGRFRKDLFFRLRAHAVELPPLRARPGDVPLLLRHFIAGAAAELDRPGVELPAELPGLLAGYPFPGNVRELQALVHDAVSCTPPGAPLALAPFRRAVTDPPLSGEGLLLPGVAAPTTAADPGQVVFPADLPGLAEVQAQLVAEALRRAGGNQARAATLLGISRQALNKRLRG